MFDWEQIKSATDAVLFAIVAGIGGGVAYLSSTFGTRKKFVLSDFMVKIISSGFSGLVIGWLLMYYEFPINIICSITGCAGYLGSEVAIGIIKRVILKKLDMKEGE